MFGNFRKELETRVPLNGPEFQDALSKEVAKEEQRHEQRVKELQEKINMLNQKYKELEDEFRLALTIEAKRFKEVRLRTFNLKVGGVVVLLNVLVWGLVFCLFVLWVF